jgi:hypothetical protein
MKSMIRFLSVVIFYVTTINISFAHDEFTRVIKKEFAVNADAQLIIDNSFGKVHCNNWDKDIVEIEVLITAYAPDEKYANKILEKVNVTISGSASLVEARTTITDGGYNKGRSGVSVDYTVNMPTSVNLDLTNKFGDIFINELGGKGKINLGYGNLEANKFSNSDNLIDIKFSKANIKSIKGAVVSLKYSDLELGYAGSLRLDSKYSNIDAEKIISLLVNFEGGKLNMENSSVIESKSKFSDLNVTRLEKSLSLDIQYGNCEIDEMLSDFTNISIRNKYGNVSVGIPENANYALDAEMKFCNLDFPEDKAIINQRIITNTSKSYKASIGKESEPMAKIYVRSEFGNVSLE